MNRRQKVKFVLDRLYKKHGGTPTAAAVADLVTSPGFDAETEQRFESCYHCGEVEVDVDDGSSCADCLEAQEKADLGEPHKHRYGQDRLCHFCGEAKSK